MSSSKRPISFYISLSKRLLAEHGEIQLSALGQGIGSLVPVPWLWLTMISQACLICALSLPAAISTLVSIAEILKKDKLALEKSESLLHLTMISYRVFSTDPQLPMHDPHANR